MAAQIKTLKDSSGVDIIYPQTKAEAVFTANGQTVEVGLQSKLTTPTGNVGQFLGFTSDNVVGAVDAPSTGGSFYNSMFVGTLSPSSWISDGAGGYYQQFNITDVTAEQHPLVFPNWTTNKTLEQKSWNMIDNGVESFNGYVRFYSKTPTVTAVEFVLLFGLIDSKLVTLVKEQIETTGTFIPG